MKNPEALKKVPTATPEASEVVAAPEFNEKTASNDEKLERGWRYITIPDRDVYDFEFKGIYLNNEHFSPGKHLVHPDKADSIEERLVAWQKYNVRLMRPQADLTSLGQLPGNRN